MMETCECRCHTSPPCSHCVGDCGCERFCIKCDAEITTREEIDQKSHCDDCWEKKQNEEKAKANIPNP